MKLAWPIPALGAAVSAVALPQLALAQGIPTIPALPSLSVQIGAPGTSSLSSTVELLLLVSVLSLAPALLVLMTSFTRIVIVLGFVRSALGTQNIPPNQVIIGLSLFLTFFVMAPVAHQIQTQAIAPLTAGRITQTQSLNRALIPVRAFMLRQTRTQDLNMFVALAHIATPKRPTDVPTYVLVPAFAISELTTAFQMGFMVFLPFLIIDLVVSSTLMSMGMLFLPPTLVSLPFKLLLFVLVDGWSLVVQSVVQSFH